MLGELSEHLRWTLTWDQGFELACHQQIAPRLSEGVFFAHPARPWQRGTNENTDGLLRHYFRKGTDPSAHTTPADLRAVQERLNQRPREILNWRTPANMLHDAMAP